MNTPVTEGHRELLHQLLMNVEHGYLKEAAQLIADSEALACAELRAELATCKDASEALVESLRAEMERLKPYVSKAVVTHEGTMLCSPLVAVKFNEQTARAESAEREVERLRKCCDQTSALCGKFITEDDGTDLIPNSARIANSLTRLEARAERAEASLHALRLVCGTTDADKFSTWVDRANAKAEKAEAELANIRALANRRNKRDHSADTTHQLVAALDQALDIAQAELATERAKYNQLLSALVYADQILDDIDTCSDAHKPMYSSYSQNVFKLCIKGRDARRAAIDAAMKEDTK